MYRSKNDISDAENFKFASLFQCFIFLLVIYLLGVLIFTISRILLLYINGGANVIEGSQDFIRVMQLGFLYDSKTISTLLIFLYSITLFGLGLPKSFLSCYSKTPLKICSVFILSFCIFLSIVNFYYFKFFNSHIDLRFFGIAGGDANAVWSSVWEDYPVIRASLFLILISFFLYRVLGSLQNKIYIIKFNPNLFFKTIFIIFSLMLFILAVRGSIGKFPLREQQSIFSENNLFNQSSLNGVSAFYYSYQRKKNQIKPVLVTKDQGVKAYNIYFNKKLTPDKFSYDLLYTKTKKSDFLKNNPPNVVFVQMESMGRNFLLMQNKDNNLVGKLGPRLKKDMVFYNFVSGGNGTAPSLALFLFNSPISFIFQMPLQNTLEYSIAKPYKEKGYETVFITSGNIGWMNLGSLLLKQYFDHTYGKSEILKKYPNAQTEPWGVYDSYAFDYAYDLLTQANKDHKKIFIYFNTVSNHPPHSLPSDYKPYPIKVPNDLPKRMKMNKSEVKKVLATYQYANDALGGFVDKVSKSDFGSKTIIGASGDHNMLSLVGSGYSNYRTYGLQYEVPFFLYAPKAYLDHNGFVYNPKRLGSHKDIFPTLFNLSLSDAKYLNFGDNILLDENSYASKNKINFGYNKSLVMLDDGVIRLGHNDKLFRWVDDKKLSVKKPESLDSKHKKVLARIKAYEYLLFWQYEKQLEMAKITF